jgi:aspartate racemase
MKKVCGILGGMGPMATADLFMKIIRSTKAESDGEHMRVLIDSNTNIPDRTAAILHGGTSPLSELLRSAKTLERAGADFLIMPCNTAHYFYTDIKEGICVPLLNMIEETVKAAAAQGVKTAGLLATDGTREAGIYDAPFERAGIALIKPSKEGQKALMDMIYNGVKAGKTTFDTTNIKKELLSMREQGTECFVLACTELPLAFAQYGFDFPMLDPTDTLARAAVVFGGYTLADHGGIS